MKISIIGTAGLPARYGGFETLAENLVREWFHDNLLDTHEVTVFCSSYKLSSAPPSNYNGAQLSYIPFNANGIQSVIYDGMSLIKALYNRADVVILLGVSGGIFTPLTSLFNTQIICNPDGIEWRRAKWGLFASQFLKLSEFLCVRFSSKVIADNEAIKQYIEEQYKRTATVITYGGDHAIRDIESMSLPLLNNLPKKYYFSLCRIEPENNVDLILSSFVRQDKNIVFVGNWQNSKYGRSLRFKYGNESNIFLLDAIYDLDILYILRSKCLAYIHGHSAGGTNPALVEMMALGANVIAFDCSFNRYTTNQSAEYFATESDLTDKLLLNVDNGVLMKQYATHNYTWKTIARQYFAAITN